jgi:hypothetical protein
VKVRIKVKTGPLTFQSFVDNHERQPETSSNFVSVTVFLKASGYFPFVSV